MITDQRLSRLERQNARLKVVVAGMAVVLAVVFLVAAGKYEDQDKPGVRKEVRAKRFVVVDEEGRNRGLIAVKKGSPGIAFVDAAGRLRAGLGCSDQAGSGLTLWDPGTESFFRIGQLPTGCMGLQLLGGEGDARIELRSNPAHPRTLATDENPNPEWPRQPTIVIYDKKGLIVFEAPE